MSATIESLIETLVGCKRYLEIVNRNDNVTISSIPKCDGNVVTIEFHGHNAAWEKELWIGNNGELHIENPITRESIFEYAEEYEWSKEDIQYIKYGNVEVK